jgi:hypothetical protein
LAARIRLVESGRGPFDSTDKRPDFCRADANEKTNRPGGDPCERLLRG